MSGKPIGPCWRLILAGLFVEKHRRAPATPAEWFEAGTLALEWQRRVG